MGLHTGVCEERDGDYFGPVVNRIARLEAVAHGGQVLVSGVTAELLSDALPAGVSLRDLGPAPAEGPRPARAGVPARGDVPAAAFPPLASLDNPELPNNLPSVLSAFVGREQELADVRELVGSARLVTLTGAGGSGKTRLALQAAAELIGVARDGVWFAELAPLTDGAQVARAVAAVLGLPDQGSQADAVTDALAGQDALILLDNCEHLIDAAAKLCDQVIRRCPRVRLLATSREPLGIDGERVYRVPSLTLPGSDAVSADDLAGSDAVAAVRRAGPHARSAVRARRRVGAAGRDHLPAARRHPARAGAGRRAAVVDVAARRSATRLDQRFRLLTGGSRNAMPRQQTLQATVDWSFGLLSPAERDALTRLSVFAGGFELEAAEAICASAGGRRAGCAWTCSAPWSTRAWSSPIAAASRSATGCWRRSGSTARRNSLRAAGEAEAMRVRDRHADYYLSLAEAIAPRLTGPHAGPVPAPARTPSGTTCAPRSRTCGPTSGSGDVLRLGVAVGRFVLSRGHAESSPTWARRWTCRLRDGRPDAVAPTAGDGARRAAGRAHQAVAQLTMLLLRKDPRELPGAKRHAERALELARMSGNVLR